MRKQAAIVTLGVVASLGYLAARARADVPTATEVPLRYAGRLTDDAGAPAPNEPVTVALFAAPMGGSPLCSGTATTAADGSFLAELSIGADCATATQGAATWVQVSTPSGPLPRVRLGSVPYALEALRIPRSEFFVDSSASAERVERFLMGGTCSNAMCPPESQSLGIQSVTRSALGTYQVSFMPSTFATKPTCSVAWRGNQGFTTVEPISPTLVEIHTTSDGVAATDADLGILCMGARP